MAIASRVSRLEADTARLRRDLADRDRAEADLRACLADSDMRLAAALDENAKLAKERDSLVATVKKLTRNLAKGIFVPNMDRFNEESEHGLTVAKRSNLNPLPKME
ncbi:hypothetical protein Zm00014a_002239 [Zea mays]|uniref:Uncharacterized protein n=1 Tax=Zea mays TaxID=4577 RepID=A0A317YFJ6_MAIZE|nr:hypothetical protein Zm00014a_002239 [Zea mays]